MPDERAPWRIISSTLVIDSRYLRLRSDVIELPNGTRIEDYFVRETRGFAVVFARTPDERVVLVRQYKHGIGAYVLELPAGAIDEGETAQECAVRELREETGYGGGRVEHVRRFITDPTNSNGRFDLYYMADAVRVGSQELETTEAITVELATLDELRELVRSGAIDVNSHVASVYTMLEYLGRL